MPSLRPFQPQDLPGLYRVCLLTADTGEDGSHLFEDQQLIGHIFAAPYAKYEPELCFVLEENGQICGYILGTSDSSAFTVWCDKHWFPPLKAIYPEPPQTDQTLSAKCIRYIYEGYNFHPKVVESHAHLHIDLLPQVKGQGWGRKLMEHFKQALLKKGVTSLALSVSNKNEGAIAFYHKMGFNLLSEETDYRVFGKSIS